jgi:hypothetical protein
MLLDTLQSELLRLQIHPVNLSVSAGDDQFVTLRGSLLNYWKVPTTLDGQWLHGILQTLPDAAGPELVMSALCTAQVSNGPLPTDAMNTAARPVVVIGRANA